MSRCAESVYRCVTRFAGLVDGGGFRELLKCLTGGAHSLAGRVEVLLHPSGLLLNARVLSEAVHGGIGTVGDGFEMSTDCPELALEPDAVFNEADASGLVRLCGADCVVELLDRRVGCRARLFQTATQLLDCGCPVLHALEISVVEVDLRKCESHSGLPCGLEGFERDTYGVPCWRGAGMRSGCFEPARRGRERINEGLA